MWMCKHCGAQIPNRESNRCPSCEENPFKLEKDELFDYDPRLIRPAELNRMTRVVRRDNGNHLSKKFRKQSKTLE